MSLLRSSSPARSLLNRFRRDQRGNIAAIFALASVPVVGMVGAAVDYSRANAARSSMQSALDSAALMLSKDLASGLIKSTDVSTKATSYFKALYTSPDADGAAVAASYTPTNSKGVSTILLNGTATIATDFMKVAGFSNLNLSASSTASWGGTRMRVAMALDVTGSMADDGKIGAMQTAAKGLIDTLSNMAKTADDIYVSVVPFAQMVNVGKSNVNASWLKWTDWDSNNGQWSWSSRNGWYWNPNDHSNWGGCVTDRDQPNDTTSTSPTTSATQYPTVQYTQNGSNICPASILPMTSVFTSAGGDTSTDTTTIKGKINSLSPNGGTNQPIGLAWAWQTLLPQAPFAAPAKDSNYTYTDVVIILSDGLNTIDRWYGNGSDPSSQVDARQKILCDNIKTKDPTTGTRPQMFTIQVNTSGDPTSAVLQYCADTGNFYSTTSAAGISTAFKAIGNSLSKLRVAK